MVSTAPNNALAAKQAQENRTGKRYLHRTDVGFSVWWT